MSIPSEYYTAEDNLTNNWNPFDTGDQQVVRDIFNRLGEELAIDFLEVAEGGDIRFNKIDMSNGQLSGFSYYPGERGDPLAGDVFIANNYDADGGNTHGTDGWFTIVHEIGHALGLKHPFEGIHQLPVEEENTQYTVMTYTAKGVTGIDFGHEEGSCIAHFPFDKFPDAFQLYDVAALQALYGANTDYASEADRYDLSSLTDNGDYTLIWDAGGNDTIDLSGTTKENKIFLAEGKLSSVDIDSTEEQIERTVENYLLQGCSEAEVREWVESVYSDPDVQQYLYTGEDTLSIAQGVLIENVVTGSGDDIIYGNSLDNLIVSGEGNDWIYLSDGGYDIVMGGRGNDKVYVEGVSSEYLLKDVEADRWLVEALNEENSYVELWNVETIVFSDKAVTLG
jgi:fermentation-respiration switch protein FrsA (DUF1100 family)